MPTYALLGATGSTGSAILRSLLSNPPEDLTLNIFVRSPSKLSKAFPGLEQTPSFRVNIIEGTPSDSSALQRCLDKADVIMACIATNESRPGQTLSFDTATSIISALKHLRASNNPATDRTPTILQLRSTSENAIFNAQTPWFQHYVIHFCLYHVYHDTDNACDAYRAAAKETPGLLEYIFVDPPALHDTNPVPTGHKLTVKEMPAPNLTYADLGAGFCEIAARREEFCGLGVGVSATGRVETDWATLRGYLSRAVWARFFG